MINGSKSSQSGFTIVEVIMFLAISGLMIAGLLFAVSGGINKERYRDATNSFTDFLKEQYNLVDNVQNARDTDGSGPDGCGGDGDRRATSNCTIIGRYITSDGEKFTSWPIIATSDVVGVLDGLSSGDDAKSVYGKLSLNVARDVKEMTREYTLRWKTRLVAPVSKAGTSSAPARAFRMVLLRSPLTSTINTYYTNGAVETPNAMEVVTNSATEKVYLCVDPDGLAPDKTGVSIDPAGVNSSAIQFATATECRS